MSIARRILIVDDEQGIRAALGQLLEYEGYEVRAVGNAATGWPSTRMRARISCSST